MKWLKKIFTFQNYCFFCGGFFICVGCLGLVFSGDWKNAPYYYRFVTFISLAFSVVVVGYVDRINEKLDKLLAEKEAP